MPGGRRHYASMPLLPIAISFAMSIAFAHKSFLPYLQA
jgi:hypothetical protein